MSKFKFPESIKSRPVYGELEGRLGESHLCIADAEGAEALLDLAKANPDILNGMHIIFIRADSEDTYTQLLESLGAAQLYIGPSFESAIHRLRRVLSDSHMGMQVYLAGTEGLIGQAMAEITSVGIPPSSIQTEHRGSVARRVQCVHCKGVSENISQTPFVCNHCGLNLFVRDHYSRRLAAFQGVCVDAEDPGNVPPVEELYP